jgi:hypothetical protein
MPDAGELAVSEVTLRAYAELQQYLDTGTHSRVEDLRGAPAADRMFRQSQIAAAVRFCARVFGPQYAALLGKAAEVAAGSAPRGGRQGLKWRPETACRAYQAGCRAGAGRSHLRRRSGPN